jgi:hypothetical protein
MIRQDPLLNELEMDIEDCLQKYRNAGGSPQGVIAWMANYLEHMIRAQPKKLRDEIKTAIHKRICDMDDD